MQCSDDDLLALQLYLCTLTSREQTFDPWPKWALVPAFFALGTRDTFSPGWWLQPGLKVTFQPPAQPRSGSRPLLPVEATNRE